MIDARTASLILGLTFIFTGLVGFIPNPLVSASGIFVTNSMHNLVHLLTGGVFLTALRLHGKASYVIISIGVAYVLVTVLGFMTSGDYLLGLVHINQADRWLHAGLAAAILFIGIVSQNKAHTDEHHQTTAADGI